MTADLNHHFSLAVTPIGAFEMLTNPDFLEEKVKLANSGDFEITGTSPNPKIQINRQVNADLPQMVRKFVGDNLIVQEFQNWQQISKNHFLAKFELRIPNAPVQISGEIDLAGAESTLVRLTGHVKVNVPIFGAAAEPHVVDTIKKVLVDEEALCQRWINS